MYNSFSEVKSEASEKMGKAVDVLKKDLAGLRTGRASVGLLEGVMVLAYGQPTPISQVASLSTPDARTIGVSVWDKSVAPAVEKAIRDSNLGLNPASDGTLIRIPLPAPSEERRRELSKIAAGYAEQARQSIRHVRHDAMEGVKQLERDKIVSEDGRRVHEDEIQKLTDKFVSDVDQHVKAKQADIMTI